jgi:integrase
MPGVLRDLLTEHRATTEHSLPDALVFGRSATRPFNTTADYTRARAAWKAATVTEAYTLHEARHTYASLMAVAGVRIEDLSEYMGHASLDVTIKLYRHLYPESAEDGCQRARRAPRACRHDRATRAPLRWRWHLPSPRSSLARSRS